MTIQRDRLLGRVSALLLLTAAFTLGLARTGTTVMHTGPTANYGPPVQTHHGGSHATGGGGGGGTIHTGS